MLAYISDIDHHHGGFTLTLLSAVYAAMPDIDAMRAIYAIEGVRRLRGDMRSERHARMRREKILFENVFSLIIC